MRNGTEHDGGGSPIDELICRSLKGATTAAEEARLLAWRQSSAANEEYHRQLVQLLRLAETVPVAEDLRRPTAAQLIAVAPEYGGRARPGRWSGPWRFVVPFAIAASIAVVFAVGRVALRPAAAPFHMGAGEFVTGETETTTVTLGDGTVVRLAPRSRLRVAGVAGRRDVHLEGRAYFAVAKMEGLPFRVYTANGVVEVLGTQFDVAADEELRVVVVEGRVSLGANGQKQDVNASEMSIATRGMVTPPVKVDVEPIVAWVGQFVAFQETPLREAAKVLERRYGVRVVVTDSALAELTITGWYVDRSLEEVVTIMCGVVGATCSVQDGTAMIEP